MSDSRPQMIGPARFAALDGLRGVAALLVVWFHLSTRVPGWTRLSQHAYLAVDFFLMLSGFVIALSYEQKIRAGFRIRDFCVRRAIRLYPVAIVGSAVGIVSLWVYQSLRAGSAVPTETLVAASLLNLLILPYFSVKFFDGYLFPNNVPLWSLFGEIAVNFFWAGLVMSGAGRRWKFIAAGVAGGGFLLETILTGTANLGWGAQTFIGGIFRVVFCFLVGTICYDFHSYIKMNAPSANFATLAAALSAALLMPFSGAAWDIFTVFFVLPLILAGGIAIGRSASAPVLEFLGDISYPLYVIHFPILLVVLKLRDMLFPAVPAFVGGLVTLASVIPAAIVLHYGFDLPVRRALSRRIAAVTASL